MALKLRIGASASLSSPDSLNRGTRRLRAPLDPLLLELGGKSRGENALESS